MPLLGTDEDSLNGFLAHGINIAAVSQTKQCSQIEETPAKYVRSVFYVRRLSRRICRKKV